MRSRPSPGTGSHPKLGDGVVTGQVPPVTLTGHGTGYGIIAS